MYKCNITGNVFDLEDNEKHREGASMFGFNSRFRAICYTFTKLFYGKCEILSNLPENKNLKGIGMSDASWAFIFETKFDYVNTFYHKHPFLDIYDLNHVKRYTDLDFIISSDVFEHVDPYPSLQTAFDNLYGMLKSNGRLIFSVPYTEGVHIEHFPNLYKYRFEKTEKNEYVLINTTIDGKIETFRDLCFHGGDGNVLEMRIFSQTSIINYLQKSGFIDITFHDLDEDMEKYGIFASSAIVISAKKP